MWPHVTWFVYAQRDSTATLGIRYGPWTMLAPIRFTCGTGLKAA